MSDAISRRSFATLGTTAILGGVTALHGQEPKTVEPKPAEKTPPMPVETPFERDYPAPNFKPSWKRQQINRLLIQDFVIYAHSDLEMTKKLLEKEPMLINSVMDWGGGDWESGLGGASHMGRRDIVELLLEKGARLDLFCAAMLGLLDAVKAFLTLQPKLVDARGPHGFTLHFHAQVGGKHAEKVLDYLQTVKKVELKPNPFLKKDGEKKDADKKDGEQKEAEKKPE